MRNGIKRLNLLSRRVPTPLRLAAGLAGMALVGTLMLSLPFVGATRSLALNEAFFTAVSALTVTGLSIINPGSDLSFAGQVILLMLIQLGGVGYMVMAVVVFRLLGRSISFADRLALRDSFGLLNLNAILKLTRRVLLSVLAIETIGAFLLWLQWRSLLGDARGAFYALFHAVSAFCNAGFDLFSGTPGFTGIPKDTASLSIFGVLIFLGGLGIPVVTDLLMWQRIQRLSLHTRLTLIVSLGLILFGWGTLFFAETRPGATLSEMGTPRALAVSLFQSVSARTAGFSGIDRFQDLTPASQLTKISLMFIGTAPASMGGGITTGTFSVLVLALWAYARGRETPHAFGRSIGTGTVRRAAAVLTVSLMVVISATWLLLMTHPQAELDRTLFEVVSAFATCGLSLAYTSTLDIGGQMIIAFVMLWGRLGALTVIMALAQLTPPRLLAYPEEQILV